MKVQNKAKHAFVHSVQNEKRQPEMLILKPGEAKEIPDEVAEQWLKTGEVIKFADPDELEKVKAKLAALEAKENKESRSAYAPTNASLDELKKEADELGIKYAKNIGAAKLAEKIAKAKENK